MATKSKSQDELKKTLRHEFKVQFGDASDTAADRDADKLVNEIFKRKNRGYLDLIVDAYNEMNNIPTPVRESVYSRKCEKFFAAVNGAAWTFLHDHK